MKLIASDYFTNPPLTQEKVTTAEQRLGVRLPSAYVAQLWEVNGGVPDKKRCPTTFDTSWEEDHFAVAMVMGIGAPDGIDDPDGGSDYLIQEWGYPPVGVVICGTPSAGHDTVMLDYSTCGAQGEPSVVYVDEDRIPKTVAKDFEEFWNALY